MCRLADVEESLWSNLLFGVGGKMHSFEMAHLWIDVFRADDFVSGFASRLEFEIDNIVRNLMIRIVCPMIVIQLTLLL